MHAQLRKALYNTGVYHWSLRGSVPERLRGIPPDPLPGNALAGQEILNGNYMMYGQYQHLGDLPWRNTRLSHQKKHLLHRFLFLADLKALGTRDAAEKGRELMTRWINEYGRWQEGSWDPHVTGSRLVNWLRTYDFLGNPEHKGFELTFLESCALQVRHLSRTIEDAPGDEHAIEAAEGLILGAICLNGMESVLDTGMTALEIALERQILGDGGHFQRNPYVQFQVLVRLVRLRDTLLAAQLEAPGWLLNAIDRMVPMLRAYCHGDGRLALFNGASEADSASIRNLIKASGTKAKTLLSASHSGFQRAETKNSVLITDAGAAVVSGASREAHAGLLSFEFSYKQHRIIVNCGACADESDDWHTALRATAAHSTLSIDDTNAIEVLEAGGLGQLDTHVSARRNESDGSSFLQMRHDGYRKAFGLVHSRDMYLSAAGDDLRGRDQLKLMLDHDGHQARLFAVRFHIHPDISVELSGDQKSAILKVSKREGWRFRCSGGTLNIEDSVYIGAPNRKRRTKQLVISGPVNTEEIEIRWSLIKEG